MDLTRGPDRALSPAQQPSGAQVESHPHVEARDAALARLPADERRTLAGLAQTVETHFDAIRAGGAVPAGFGGVVRAYDTTHRIGGVPVSPDYVDVRATIEAMQPATRNPAAQDPAGPARPEETADSTRGLRPEPAAARLDPEAVAWGTAVFDDALHRTVTDWTVTKADLDRITAVVRLLGPEDMQAVYRALSEPMRERWASELAADYSTAERSELYGMLAERFDRLHLLEFAYYHQHAGSDGTDGRLLGQAVAEHAPEAVTEAFVRDAAAYTVPAEERGALHESSSAFSARPEIGVAAAAALAGLHGPAFDRTLGALHEARTLSTVVGRAVHYETASLGSDRLPSALVVDASVLEGILAAGARSRNMLGQASLVDAASGVLGGLERARAGSGRVAGVDGVAGTDVAGGVRDGITAVLEQNPVGIVRQYWEVLGVGGETRHLPEYMASMIGAGQSAEIGTLLTRLGTGDGSANSSAEWAMMLYTYNKGEPYFANAQMVGYAVGSVEAAIGLRSQDAREQGQLIKGIFGGVAVGVGAVPHPAAGTVAAVLTGLSTVSVDAVVAQHQNADDSLARQILDLSYPMDARGNPMRGGAREAFTEGVGRGVGRATSGAQR